MDKDAAYAEIERNGGAAYAKTFAARYPDEPLTPFCHRYLFEQAQRDEAEHDAGAATHDDERGFALRSLARMEASSHIAQAAASASRDAAAAAHTSGARGSALGLLDHDRRARVGDGRSGKRGPQSRLARMGKASCAISDASGRAFAPVNVMCIGGANGASPQTTRQPMHVPHRYDIDATRLHERVDRTNRPIGACRGRSERSIILQVSFSFAPYYLRHCPWPFRTAAAATCGSSTGFHDLHSGNGTDRFLTEN
ncbi:hypothetical protein [Paraburkholderia youngii]|uniref:hypothetical protein n=1 Tax=Paraburkholderia youngii TaxID=2782701 RepID=UPI003D1FA0A4